MNSSNGFYPYWGQVRIFRPNTTGVGWHEYAQIGLSEYINEHKVALSTPFVATGGNRVGITEELDGYWRGVGGPSR